jgi:hypothetical protein
MSNEASRRQEFKKALVRLLPTSGGTDYAAGIAMLENIFRAGVMDATWRLWSTRKELAGWCFFLPVAWS